MVMIAADKAMVEANLAMAVAENLVTDEMKVTDAGVVVGMVTNLSSRLVLDEEGMGMVMVDMDRGILRKDAGSVWLWSSPLQGLLAFSPIIRHSHVTRISQLSHPHTTNIRIQSYSPKLRINFILVRISHPSRINMQVEVLEQEANTIPLNLISRITHRRMGTLGLLP